MTDRIDAIRQKLASIPDGWVGAWFTAEEIREVLAANDRLARIASQVAVTLEEGKRDLMAHAWDRGYLDGRRQDAEGDDGPRFVNPYKETSDD